MEDQQSTNQQQAPEPNQPPAQPSATPPPPQPSQPVAEPAEPMSQSVAEPVKKKTGMFVPIIVSLFVLGLIGGSVYYFYFRTDEAEEPVTTAPTTETSETVTSELQIDSSDLIETYAEYKNATDPKSVKHIQEQLDINELYDARAKMTVYENGEPAYNIAQKEADQLNEQEYSLLNQHCKLEAIYKREEMFDLANNNFDYDTKTDQNGMFFDAFYSEKYKKCFVTYFWQYKDTPEEVSYNTYFYPLDRAHGQEFINNFTMKSGKKYLLDFNEFEALAKQTLVDKFTEHYSEFSLSAVKEAGLVQETSVQSTERKLPGLPSKPAE